MTKHSKFSASMKVAASAIGFSLLAAGTAMASGGDTGVSNDGRAVATTEYSRTMAGASGYKGVGAVTSRTVDSASEFSRVKALRAVSAADGTESIIGTDNRFQVTNTTAYPARANVLITFSAGRCSGWMFGPNLVVTAGHCVANETTGVFYPISSYRVYPGRNGASSPFGSCTARRLFSVTGWTVSHSEEFDYGAIKLNCNIGNNTGWFGAWWQTASLTGLFSRVSGYPGDKPLTQWMSFDSIRATSTNQLFYQNDTVGGNSGGPVWQNRASGSSFCSGACVMAIHAYGLHGSAPHSTNNHGTRLTQARFNNLMSWRNLP